MPCKSWELVGADIFTIKNSILLCIVDYHSKFPIVKKGDGLSEGNLIRVAKIVFVEFGLPKKMVSYAGTNFISDKSRQFFMQLNIGAGHNSYHHQGSGTSGKNATNL